MSPFGELTPYEAPVFTPCTHILMHVIMVTDR